MVKIKTKFGNLYVRKTDEGYEILDSKKRIMFYDQTESDVVRNIEYMERFDTIDDWLRETDDVCWGAYQDIKECAKNYCDERNYIFDFDWFKAYYNKLGNTYILFDYSDCYKEEE